MGKVLRSSEWFLSKSLRYIYVRYISVRRAAMRLAISDHMSLPVLDMRLEEFEW